MEVELGDGQRDWGDTIIASMGWGHELRVYERTGVGLIPLLCLWRLRCKMDGETVEVLGLV